jgi:hypothetical protein
MADLGDLLEEEILRGAPVFRSLDPTVLLSPGELLDAMPGVGWSRKMRELTELEAGSNRGGAAYKNASARLRRQNPSPARKARGAKASKASRQSRRRNLKTQLELRGKELEAHEYLVELRLHGGEVRYYVRISADEFWAPRGEGTIHIPQRAMRTILRTWADGEKELAGEELLYEFEARYPLPDPEILDMRLDPSQGGGADDRYTKPTSPYARVQ